jgi:hypothetical protein
MRRLPRGAHPHPHAAGRGDGPRAERWNGPAGSGLREARYATQRGHGSIARRICAAVVLAARRHPGEVVRDNAAATTLDLRVSPTRLFLHVVFEKNKYTDAINAGLTSPPFVIANRAGQHC